MNSLNTCQLNDVEINDVVILFCDLNVIYNTSNHFYMLSRYIINLNGSYNMWKKLNYLLLSCKKVSRITFFNIYCLS